MFLHILLTALSIRASALSYSFGSNSSSKFDFEVLVNATGVLLDSFYRGSTTTVFMAVSAETEHEYHRHFQLRTELMVSQRWNMSFATETDSLDNKLFRRFFSIFIVESYQSFR